MNLTELRVARIRRGVKAQELADAIDRTVDSYIKRENGNVRVTLSDALIITQVLSLPRWNQRLALRAVRVARSVLRRLDEQYHTPARKSAGLNLTKR